MRIRDDRGSVAAEFAVTVPAVIAVVVLVIGAFSVVGQKIQLEQTAAAAARVVAREGGDPGALARRVGAQAAVANADDLVCVTLTASPFGDLPLPPISARSCALSDGR